jgi:hypothetical protein
LRQDATGDKASGNGEINGLVRRRGHLVELVAIGQDPVYEANLGSRALGGNRFAEQHQLHR